MKGKRKAMKKYKRFLTVVLAGAMLLGTASCGKADPDDYEYGQSINQLTGDNNVIAGNGGGDDNGGGESGGGDDNGGVDNPLGGMGNTDVSDMDKWIEKLDSHPVPVEYADAENKEQTGKVGK